MSPVQPPLPAVPPPTRQLPLVPPPAGAVAPDATGSSEATSTAGAGPVPTGPVDWMPLPPEPGAVPPDPYRAPAGAHGSSAAGPGDTPDAGHQRADRRRVRLRLPAAPRSPRGSRGTAAAGLGAVAVLLLELGLVMHQAGTTLWGRVPLWAAFATVAALVGLVAVGGLRAAPAVRDRAWAIGAGGLTGTAVFWVLVVLPGADTDRGFVLTAALACLGGCLWLTAGHNRAARPEPVPEADQPQSGPSVTGWDDEPADEVASAPDEDYSTVDSPEPSPVA